MDAAKGGGLSAPVRGQWAAPCLAFQFGLANWRIHPSRDLKLPAPWGRSRRSSLRCIHTAVVEAWTRRLPRGGQGPWLGVGPDRLPPIAGPVRARAKAPCFT
jgi:hypothetical protein